MKLLFDQNLSTRVVSALAIEYPEHDVLCSRAGTSHCVEGSPQVAVAMGLTSAEAARMGIQ
jgi:hypothetical protein